MVQRIDVAPLRAAANQYCAMKPAILLQQYRHFSEVASVAFGGRSRFQSGLCL